MRYSPEHKDKTRALVLAEAGKAIRKDGPHQVSLAAVMKRAGLTHGGFYAHWKSRDAMLAAAIAQMFDSSRDRWMHETLDRTPEQGLVRYIDWYLSKTHRDSRESGCAISALASDLPRLSPACQKVYSEGTRRVISYIASHVTLLDHPDADELAASILSEMVGALSLARIEMESRRSDAILSAARRSVKKRLGVPAQ